MNYTIREYETSDLEDLLNTWENAAYLAHPFLTKEFQDQVRHDIPNVYLPNTQTWVAVYQGKVIGFISMMGNEIGALFVEPEFHGTGAGRLLVGKALELQDELEVEVFEANSIGRNFYHSYGFEPIEEKVHTETGQIALRLKYSSSK
ncbi:putative N-acetyltransferase YjaB [Polystyrenella longa]|uniref:Putative N-acetyltransferase YjaB n=1 Tax=Polystyrenella longa TaxID=2528007 RepID=A0A518CUB6_9PLAN|nr:GNAT family N-acetyltransferase [Polystyrenella longa]QDU82823.1 putative N-acetyltransferase YjaB [Polystyrenella longa]